MSETQIFFYVSTETKKKLKSELAKNEDSIKDVLTNAILDYIENKGNVPWNKK